MPDGTPVYRVTLENEDLRVRIITYGAAIQSIEAPDRHGNRANVTLGLSTLPDYIARSPHFGAVPGRYAGRIARGRFSLDGVEYQLPCNDGPNSRHSGPNGFGKRAWQLAGNEPDHATLTLSSPDGDTGFPGSVEVSVTYTLDHADIRIDYHAETTRPTILNLTNHSYFNLAGEGSGSILDHELTIDADHFAPLDAQNIPTGALLPVEGTPFDFRTAQTIGARIHIADPQLVQALGYDHPYLLRGTGLRRAALLQDPGSGRTLTVLTTEPSIQLYTANSLTGALAGLSGSTYRQSDAVCLEAQHLPDSPNQPDFPSTVLRPDHPFDSATIFRFSVLED